MSDVEPTKASRALAKIQRTWWPGWIWSVPIAVLLVVTWLGLRALTSGGTDITIVFDNANGLEKEHSDVVYRGTPVGKVTAVSLTEDGRAVNVTASIEGSATRFLKSGTRFWLKGARPSLAEPGTLRSILAGPTIVMEPGRGEKTTHFQGLARKPIRPAGDAHAQPFRVSFDGAVGALQPGDAVQLRGFTVGEVSDVAFHFDAETGKVATPVTLALFPSLFHIEAEPNPTSPEALRTAVAALVHEGLRARLEQDPPLIGRYSVTLKIVPGAGAKTLQTVNGVPEIPVEPGGGIQSLVARVSDVPVEQIADNVLAVTRQARALVSSPALDDSVVQLHAALKQIRQTAATAGPKISHLVGTLRDTAEQLDETARSADRLVGGPASQAGLQTTIREVTDAARAIRSLADYLDRHPEALIHGRSGE